MDLRLCILLQAISWTHAFGQGVPPFRQPAITEYAEVSILDTPCETEFHPSQPDIAWVELIAGNAIMRVNVTSGEQTRFPLHSPVGLPSGMEFLPDGYLWFSDVVGNSMVRLNPTDGSMTEYPFPWTGVRLLDSLPVGPRVTIDVAGNRDRGAWFTAAGLNAIGRIDIDTFEFELFPLPGLLSVPAVIQAGPGNTMVFSELLGNRIGLIDVYTKEIREFELPTPASLPQAVHYAPDGYIWYSGMIGTIGTINPSTGEIQEIWISELRNEGNSTVVYPDGSVHPGKQDILSALLGGSVGTSGLLPLPTPLRMGSDGKVYFTQGNLVFLGNRIGQYDPRTRQLVEFVTPTGASGPCDLNNQHPGTIFFAEFTAGKLGRLDY